MVGQKNRLYIALYPSGVSNNAERKYHWAFLVGPKAEDQDEVPGTKYHVKNNPLKEWIYEELPLRNVKNSTSLLARLIVGKIEDEKRLIEIVRSVPLVQGDPAWRCRSWIEDVLHAIKSDGNAVGTSDLDWKRIEEEARKYVGGKTSSGRYATATLLEKPKPTWDMLENKEKYS